MLVEVLDLVRVDGVALDDGLRRRPLPGVRVVVPIRAGFVALIAGDEGCEERCADDGTGNAMGEHDG